MIKKSKKAQKKSRKPSKFEKAEGFLTENQTMFLTERYALMPDRARSIRKRIASKIRACASSVILIKDSPHNFGTIAKAMRALQSELVSIPIVKGPRALAPSVYDVDALFQAIVQRNTTFIKFPKKEEIEKALGAWDELDPIQIKLMENYGKPDFADSFRKYARDLTIEHKQIQKIPFDQRDEDEKEIDIELFTILQAIKPILHRIRQSRKVDWKQIAYDILYELGTKKSKKRR